VRQKGNWITVRDEKCGSEWCREKAISDFGVLFQSLSPWKDEPARNAIFRFEEHFCPEATIFTECKGGL
jgi:hypothetical protein